MNGASRTAWSIPRAQWPSWAELAGFKTLDDLPDDLTGKRVLVRVDLNVPMQDGAISDDTRLRAAVPTIAELRDKGAIVLLLSHFGRPKGQNRPDMSTALLVKPLAELTGRSVRFVEDCRARRRSAPPPSCFRATSASSRTPASMPARRRTIRELAEGMAALGDYYVNDAFSAAHRAHASTEGIAHLLPASPVGRWRRS